MKARVEALLAEPCSGWRCGGGSVRFTKRLIAGNVTIHLQCEACGRSLSGALKRSEFYSWQDFQPWNESLRTAWDEARRVESLQFASDTTEAQEKRAAEAAERRTDYRRWLMTSPDWRTLRDRVMRRSLFICEACLANKAGDVHHITYELGRLPPAWELRAVCRACHDRLHDWTGGE